MKRHPISTAAGHVSVLNRHAMALCEFGHLSLQHLALQQSRATIRECVHLVMAEPPT